MKTREYIDHLKSSLEQDILPPEGPLRELISLHKKQAAVLVLLLELPTTASEEYVGARACVVTELS